MATNRAKTAAAVIRMQAKRMLLPMLNDMMQQQRLTKDEQQHQTDGPPVHPLESVCSRVAGRLRVR